MGHGRTEMVATHSTVHQQHAYNSSRMLNAHSNSTPSFPKNRIVCIIFVLLEVAVLSLLFYLIILPIYEDSLFDRTLKLRGLRHVLKANEGNDMAKCMRGVGGGLWILLFQVSELTFSPLFFVYIYVCVCVLTQPRFVPSPERFPVGLHSRFTNALFSFLVGG